MEENWLDGVARSVAHLSRREMLTRAGKVGLGAGALALLFPWRAAADAPLPCESIGGTCVLGGRKSGCTVIKGTCKGPLVPPHSVCCL